MARKRKILIKATISDHDDLYNPVLPARSSAGDFHRPKQTIEQSMKWSEELGKNRIDPLTFDATPAQSPNDRKQIEDSNFWKGQGQS